MDGVTTPGQNDNWQQVGVGGAAEEEVAHRKTHKTINNEGKIETTNTKSRVTDPDEQFTKLSLRNNFYLKKLAVL